MHVLTKTTAVLLVSAATMILSSCQSAPDPQPDPAPSTTNSPLPSTPDEAPAPRNIIMIIGDGMGPQQMGLLQEYATRAPSSIYQGTPTTMSRLIEEGVLGMSHHAAHNQLTVDSACSATQLATGQAAPSEVIGLDKDGNPSQTILEDARAAGRATGLISDTRVTHATPSAFAAHVAHRSMENEIAVQMLEQGVDLMLAGGLRHWIPASASDPGSATHKALKERVGGTIRIKSKRKDERDLLVEAEQKGYAVVHQRHALAAVQETPVLGLFAYSGMADGVEHSARLNDPDRSEPTLAEMTAKALELLSRDEDGFFLMVEGGQIDWAAHYNDAGTLLHEMIKFDAMLKVVHDFAKDRDDTFVIVTADHETGGFGFSYSRANVPAPSKLPGSAFKDRDFRPGYNFGALSLLDRLYNQDKSFEDMFAQYDAFKAEAGADDPDKLMEIVNAHSEFKITLDDANAILAREDNVYQIEGHKYLSADTFPLVNDFEAFYMYADEVRLDLLGRALSTQQNIVWSTGAHTHTPVAVIAHGHPAWTAQYSRLMHHTDVGRMTRDLWRSTDAQGPSHDH